MTVASTLQKEEALFGHKILFLLLPPADAAILTSTQYNIMKKIAHFCSAAVKQVLLWHVAVNVVITTGLCAMFSHQCVCLSPRTTRKSHFIHRASNHSWHNFHTQASKRRQSYDHYCGNRVAVTLSTLCGSTQLHTNLHKVSTWSNSIPHHVIIVIPNIFQGYPSLLAVIVISRKSIENLVLLIRKTPEEYWIAVCNTSIISTQLRCNRNVKRDYLMG